MSIYYPKSGTLVPVKRDDERWDIHDLYGYYDGPYESQNACLEVIRREYMEE